MAQKLSIARTRSSMIIEASRSRPTRKHYRPARTVPPVWAAASIVILAGVALAGMFRTINGSWSLPARAEARFQSEVFPIVSASRGFDAPLQKENRIRAHDGRSLLAMPRDRHQIAADSYRGLAELQQRIEQQQAVR